MNPMADSETPRDVEALREEVRKGRRFEYLFFWGHRRRTDGRAGPGCLSQWYDAPFTCVDDGGPAGAGGGSSTSYPTAEHYMMAHKAALFGDEQTRQRILRAPTPAAAKKLGRQVKSFDEDRWAERRFAIVVAGNVAKFGSDPGLLGTLLDTHPRVLVEASPVDRIWGIGLSRDDPGARDPRQWRGLNLLGFALMEARDRLRGRRRG